MTKKANKIRAIKQLGRNKNIINPYHGYAQEEI